MDRPSRANITQFVHELKKCGVSDVVRVCEPTYNAEVLTKEGINLLDLTFTDGATPPTHIVEEWLLLVKQRLNERSDAVIATHCVAGLGRAPVLVAIALVECGMKYEDAVAYIRTRRRGAINAKQLDYLQKYKPLRILKAKKGKFMGCCRR